MRRTKVSSAWVTLVLLGLPLCGIFAVSGEALACKCKTGRTLADRTRDADLVFEGLVLGRQTDQNVSVSEFEVLRTFKGGATARTRIYSSASSASCGVAFQVAQRYLVFARKSDPAVHAFLPAGAYHSGACSGNEVGGAREEQLAVLGPGMAPAPELADGGCSFAVGNGGASLGIVAIVLGLWMVLRPGRRTG